MWPTGISFSLNDFIAWVFHCFCFQSVAVIIRLGTKRKACSNSRGMYIRRSPVKHAVQCAFILFNWGLNLATVLEKTLLEWCKYCNVRLTYIYFNSYFIKPEPQFIFIHQVAWQRTAMTKSNINLQYYPSPIYFPWVLIYISGNVILNFINQITKVF